MNDLILPRGTIIYVPPTAAKPTLKLDIDWSGGKPFQVVVVEVQPQILPFLVANYPYPNKLWKLAFPWQYFVNYLNEDNQYVVSPLVFWKKTRLTDRNDSVIAAKVPHVDNNGLSCIGDLIYPRGGLTKLHEAVDEVVSGFYSSHSMFAYDYRGSFHPDEYHTLKQWEDASKNDPLDYLKWPDWNTSAQLKLDNYVSYNYLAW